LRQSRPRHQLPPRRQPQQGPDLPYRQALLCSCLHRQQCRDKLMEFRVATSVDSAAWDAFVTAHPDAHTLQASDWGRLKSAFGWSSQIVAVEGDDGHIAAGAQMLFRRLPLRLGTMAYIPAGPLFCGNDPKDAANVTLWQAIDSAARSHRAVFVKVEPCNWYR